MTVAILQTAAAAPTDLLARFHPVFDRIAAGAAQRDRQRLLAHEPVQWLQDAGFGAVRVPKAYGGLGASVEQWVDLLIALAKADSNLPQIYRTHFGFLDRVLLEKDDITRQRWLPLAAQGVFFGNASTERGEAPHGQLRTTLTAAPGTPDHWLLNGEKFYSTGSLYADWIAATATQHPAEGQGEPRLVIALTPVGAPGLERVDDWDGFGQRLSGSGTTRFTDVPIPNDRVITHSHAQPSPIVALFQLVHLATVTGVAQALADDAAAYVRKRQRTFSHASGATPAQDPLVQQVVGQLASTAFVATATVRAVAASLGDVARARQAGQTVSQAQLDALELQTAKAQVGVFDSVLQAASRLFDVGGASALSAELGLDRHWRNVRTLASHNPVIYKARLVGDNAINTTPPSFHWNVGVKAS